MNDSKMTGRTIDIVIPKSFDLLKMVIRHAKTHCTAKLTAWRKYVSVCEIIMSLISGFPCHVRNKTNHGGYRESGRGEKLLLTEANQHRHAEPHPLWAIQCFNISPAGTQHRKGIMSEKECLHCFDQVHSVDNAFYSARV